MRTPLFGVPRTCAQPRERGAGTGRGVDGATTGRGGGSPPEEE